MKKVFLFFICIPIFTWGQVIDLGGGLSKDDVIKQTQFTNVSDFGARGNGISNDANAIQNAVNSAVNNKRTLRFERGKTYLINDNEITVSSDIDIDLNGATIYFNYTGTQDVDNYAYGFRSNSGSLSYTTSYTQNIYKNIDFIQTSNSSLLNDISEGDLIKIWSNKDFFNNGRNQGEIKMISRVTDTTIYFTEYFQDTYLSSDTVYIAKINPVRFNIRNGTIIGNGIDFQIGVAVSYGMEPNVENVTFIDCAYCGIYLKHAYNANVNVNGYDCNQSSAGYVVCCVGATMNPKISVRGFNVRHVVTFDGIDNGIVHNFLVYDSEARGHKGANTFDTHNNVGAGRFINCAAYGGLSFVDSLNYVGLYSSDSTYSDGEIVTFENVLYESNANDNINHSPDTLTTTYWYLYDNDTYAFKLASDNITMINCEANGNYQYGVSFARSLSGIRIDNFKMHNIFYGIHIYQVALTNCDFDNLSIINDTYKDANYFVYAREDTLTNVNFGYLKGTNINAVYNYETECDQISIDNLKVSGQIFYGGAQTNPINININTIQYTGVNSTSVFRNLGYTGNLHIGKINATNWAGNMFSFSKRVNEFSVDYANLISDGGALRFVIHDSIDYAKIGLFTANEDDAMYLYYTNNASSRIFTSYIGGVTGNFTAIYGTVLPTLEILSGEHDKPLISRGSGSPENTVTAGIGSMYLDRAGGENTTLYIKESGTGNTGWIAK